MSEAGKGTEKKSTSGASSGAASSISSIFSEEPLFSSSHVLQALESSQADLLGAKPKVAPNVPVFLAAVLEHVTAQVLNAAGKRSLDEVKTVADANAAAVTTDAAGVCCCGWRGRPCCCCPCCAVMRCCCC